MLRKATALLLALACALPAPAQKTFTVPGASLPTTQSGVPGHIRLRDSVSLAEALGAAPGSRPQLFYADSLSSPPQITSATELLVDDAAWTVPTDPLSVRWQSAGRDYTVIGIYKFADSSWWVAMRDHLTGAYTETLVHDGTNSDDHNSPSAAVGPDGRVYVAFTTDHADDPIRVYKSDAVHSIASFSQLSLTTVGDVDNAVYPRIFFTGSRLWMFFGDRDVAAFPTTRKPRFLTYSDDGGATWAARIMYLDVTDHRPYPEPRPTKATRIDLATSHGLEREALTDGDLYHAYLEEDTPGVWNWKTTAGATIGPVGSTTLTESNMTRVADASTRGHPMRTGGVTLDDSDNPILLGFEVNQTTWFTSAYSHRWNGSAWTEELIAADFSESKYGVAEVTGPDQAGYSGLGFQNRDPNKATLSANNREGGDDIVEYNRVAADDWTRTVLVDAHGGQAIRPVEPWGATPDLGPHDDLRILYMDCRPYRAFDHSTASRMAVYPGPGRWADLDSLLELDVTAGIDVVLELRVVDDPTPPPRPFAGALVRMLGEMGGGGQTIADDAGDFVSADGVSGSSIGGLTAVTVFAGLTPEAGVPSNYAVSNYPFISAPDASKQALMMRIENNGLDCILKDSVPTTNRIQPTNLNATAGEYYTFVCSWDGSTIRAAHDGVLGDATDAFTGPVNTNVAGSPLLAGASGHDLDTFDGSMGLLCVVPAGHGADWITVAAATVEPSNWAAAGFVDPPGGMVSAADLVAAIRADANLGGRLDEAISSRATPGDVTAAASAEYALGVGLGQNGADAVAFVEFTKDGAPLSIDGDDLEVYLGFYHATAGTRQLFAAPGNPYDYSGGAVTAQSYTFASTTLTDQPVWFVQVTGTIDGATRTLTSGDLPSQTLKRIDASVSSAGGGGGPVVQDPVAESVLVDLTPFRGRLLPSHTPELTVGDSDVLCGADFAKDLRVNQRVAEIVLVEQASGPAGGLTIAAAGVDDSQAKWKLTPTVAGDYEIRLRVRYTGSGGQRTVTLPWKVNP